MSIAMNPSKPCALHVVAGGRERLEQQLLEATLFGRPNAENLARQLTPAANGSVHGVPAVLSAPATPAPKNESRDTRRT